MIDYNLAPAKGYKHIDVYWKEDGAVDESVELLQTKFLKYDESVDIWHGKDSDGVEFDCYTNEIDMSTAREEPIDGAPDTSWFDD